MLGWGWIVALGIGVLGLWLVFRLVAAFFSSIAQPILTPKVKTATRSERLVGIAVCVAPFLRFALLFLFSVTEGSLRIYRPSKI
jgi:hypothetical protein